MLEKFDIQFVTSSFSSCNLLFYLDLIRSAKKSELRELRTAVKQHAKTVQPNQAFADIPNFSTHQAIVKAINYELRRRTPLGIVEYAVFPIRRFIVQTFSGMKLKLDDRFGVIYSKPTHRSSVMHTTHKEIAASAWGFIEKHEKALITMVLGLLSAWIIKKFM